jgi:membrane-associated protease RseP (regulator of RpoE activity)
MSDDETTENDDASPSASDAASPADDDETATSDATADVHPDATDGAPPPETSDADATMPGTTPVPVAPAAPAAAATNGDRAGVFVPRWVAFLVGALVAVLLVGGAGFALGRATDDGDDDERGSVVVPSDRRLPDIPGFPTPDDRGPRDIPDDRGPGDIPGVPTDRALLGVGIESATDGGRGVRVTRVVPGSPAEDAGLETGDIITKVDDTEIGNAPELVRAIGSHDPGDTVTITYERDGESDTVEATLGGGSES